MRLALRPLISLQSKLLLLLSTRSALERAVVVNFASSVYQFQDETGLAFR